MKAYTYSITHIPTGRIYYGVRKSSIEDIGITYFSSSKLVKGLILSEGLQNFRFQVRKKFEDYEKARIHETKLLRRVKAITNPKFLNQAISSPRLCKKDSLSEERRRAAISLTMKNLWKNPTYRQNQTFHKLSKEERSRRGKLGAISRKRNISQLPKKPKKPPTYSEINITRNNIVKTIKRNQVPAYKKYGWTVC